MSKFDGMIAYCRKQQEKYKSQSAPAYFRVPCRTKASRVRLFATRGPFGEVVEIDANGLSIARFPSDLVIAFLGRERQIELSKLVKAAKNAAD